MASNVNQTLGVLAFALRVVIISARRFVLVGITASNLATHQPIFTVHRWPASARKMAAMAAIAVPVTPMMTALKG